MPAELELAEGWRKTNLTWRPSLLDILPSLTVYGDDLTPAEKKALGLCRAAAGLPPGARPSTPDARAAGVRGDDVIIGIDGQPLEMTMPEFLAHVRRNYLVGDRITLQVIRDGKRPSLPMTLR